MTVFDLFLCLDYFAFIYELYIYYLLFIRARLELEREKRLLEEERKKDQLRRIDDDQNLKHKRLVEIKKKIIESTSEEEKKQILEDFDWNKYRNYSVKILMIKRQAIIEQKQKGEVNLQQWLGDIKEWEKKNMNNYEDNLKGELPHIQGVTITPHKWVPIRPITRKIT